ncbi:MAG TPA: hypothetical protein VGI17_07355 [Solirubrobacterales bacterium]|jgi:hypothetical protein
MAIEADIILAQAAQDGGAGVSALGMGWQVRPPDPIPWALVIVLQAGREHLGHDHAGAVELERADGEEMPDLQLRIEFEFTPEGLDDPAITQPVVRAVALNMPPIPLPEGTEFRFRLSVDGETKDHWVAPFRTTPP